MLKRWMLSLVVVLVWPGVCLAEHRTVVCESTDGYYHHCPVDIDGEVSLSRKLSQSPCEFDKSWGYDWKGIWVDDGCRAEFELTTSSAQGPSQPPTPSSSPYPPASPPPAHDLVVCESINSQRRYCRLDTGEGVELERQLSRSACVEGQSWGWDRDGIWVDGGCRARFRVLKHYEPTPHGPDPHGPNSSPPPGWRPEGRDERLLRCESRGRRLVECGADTSGGACLERQLSRVECVYGVNWGISRDKIWVDEGCGGEFLLGRANRYP